MFTHLRLSICFPSFLVRIENPVFTYPYDQVLRFDRIHRNKKKKWANMITKIPKWSHKSTRNKHNRDDIWNIWCTKQAWYVTSVPILESIEWFRMIIRLKLIWYSLNDELVIIPNLISCQLNRIMPLVRSPWVLTQENLIFQPSCCVLRIF